MTNNATNFGISTIHFNGPLGKVALGRRRSISLVHVSSKKYV